MENIKEKILNWLGVFAIASYCGANAEKKIISVASNCCSPTHAGICFEFCNTTPQLQIGVVWIN